MPGRVYPASGMPLSLAEIHKSMGVSRPLPEFLEFYAATDVVFQANHFNRLSLDTAHWTVANSGGSGAANFVTVAAANGIVRGTSGTTDDGSVSMVGPIIYSGDNFAGMAARFKINVTTGGEHLEVGLIDAVPGSNTGAVNDIDTPTGYATDFAVWAIDVDQTLTTSAFVTGGTALSVQKRAVADTTLPVAATYMTVVIQLLGDTNAAACWVNGKYVDTITSAIEGGTLLAPWVYNQTRSTTTKLFDVDYFHVWSRMP